MCPAVCPGTSSTSRARSRPGTASRSPSRSRVVRPSIFSPAGPKTGHFQRPRQPLEAADVVAVVVGREDGREAEPAAPRGRPARDARRPGPRPRRGGRPRRPRGSCPRRPGRDGSASWTPSLLELPHADQHARRLVRRAARGLPPREGARLPGRRDARPLRLPRAAAGTAAVRPAAREPDHAPHEDRRGRRRDRAREGPRAADRDAVDRPGAPAARARVRGGAARGPARDRPRDDARGPPHHPGLQSRGACGGCAA